MPPQEPSVPMAGVPIAAQPIAQSRFVTLRVKLLVAFTLVLGVVFAGTYFWFYRFATNKVLQSIEDELVTTMNAAASGVNGDQLLRLAAEAEPNEEGTTDDPRYWEHVEWLATVEQIEPRAYVYTYIAGPEPNTIVFIGSGSALNRDRDFDGAQFLEFYEPETPIYEGLSHQVLNINPYQDQWGYWITGYTPIMNWRGEPVAGLGVDFQAQYLLDLQKAVRDRILFAFLVAYGVLVAMVYGLSGSLTSYLSRITQAAQDIGKGNYEPERLPARSPRMADELDILVQVLRLMAGNIRQREQFLKAILEDQTEWICRFLPDGKLCFVNKAYIRKLNRSYENLIDDNFFNLIPTAHQAELQARLTALNQACPVDVWEYQESVQDSTGQVGEWHQWTIRALFQQNGQLKEFQAVGRDISQQKHTEAELEQRVEQRTVELAKLNQELDRHAHELKSSLAEKDLLLKEVHHRVKNNLQVISSLLSLQSQYIQDEDILSALTDSRSRIRSMALIHENLYQSASLAQVDFADYINTLVGYLATSYHIECDRLGEGDRTGESETSSPCPPGSVHFDVQVNNVTLGIDAAIPCGLLINELVSNSLKYAFPEATGGTISIHFTHTAPDQLQLTVRDTGVGLPADSNLDKPTSLGLRLVKALSRQLLGHATIFNDGGTVCQVNFPQPPERSWAEPSEQLD